MPTFTLLDATRERAEPGALLDRRIPAALHDHRVAAPDYRPTAALTAAVNVALAIGAPLLVTGEPGCGKTALAWYLAWYFQLPQDQPYRLNVKSTTVARDLLYTFDTVAYFHAGQDPRRRAEVLDKRTFRTAGPLWQAFLAMTGRPAPEVAADSASPTPAIVLIDEIDKAPRDFPNDLLHELDQYEFTCMETGEAVARPEFSPPPLVIVTSNSERRLPEPFLRRCVFHHIELDETTVREAVRRRGARIGLDLALQYAALAKFHYLRSLPNLRKRPSTGELLAWLAALRQAGVPAETLERAPLRDLPFAGTLLKDREDLAKLG